MRTRVQRWGNSLALRIPKALGEAVGVAQGCEVDLTVREGRLVAEPVVQVPTLEELLRGFTEENTRPYDDVPGAVGREAWPDNSVGLERLEPWISRDEIGRPDR